LEDASDRAQNELGAKRDAAGFTELDLGCVAVDLANGVTDVRDRLGELSASAWTYTAIGAAIELGLPAVMREPSEAGSLAAAAGVSVPLATSLAEALVAGGLAERTDGGFVAASGLVDLMVGGFQDGLRADLRSGLLQMAALYDGATRGDVRTGWAHTDERILQAQGVMSASAIDLLEAQVFPTMAGMKERLDAGDAVFLDVGAGVAAVSIGLCLRHPGLRAVALEPQAAPRRLAQGNVRDAGLADRVEIRAGRIEELDDREAFDLVWLPGNFLGSDALPRAFAVAHRALRPGGYLLNACLGGGGDDHRSTAARLRAVLWGGDTVAPEHVGGLLREAGFADVALMDRLPSGLVPMQARRAL
jgi:predicted O-methyltransferase YrrM